jgi:hypothetical protein
LLAVRATVSSSPNPLRNPAALAGGIGQRLDATVIEIAAAVEHDVR